MNNGQPVPDARRCSAIARRTGQRCGRPALRGGFVCHKHGGHHPHVMAKARERLNDLIDPDRALRTAAAIAYAKVSDLFDADGHFLMPKDWPEELQDAAASLKFMKKNLTAGDGRQEDVVEVKLCDKVAALRLLFQHLRLLPQDQPKVEVNVTVELARVQRLREGRLRVAQWRGLPAPPAPPKEGL